jgi:putative CocE/NonD family hydrolase
MDTCNRRAFLVRAASLLAAATLPAGCRTDGGEASTTSVEPATALPFGPIDERAEQVMVPMADGVRLATDLYLPPSPKRLPALLIRMPYDKSSDFAFMPQVARHLLDQGYAVVVQDVRGKVRSEGATFAFVHEVADGYDTLSWIERQPWSNGSVGMLGDSYYGFTQWAAAASGHHALRCMVPRMTSTEIGTDWMYRQGVFCLYTMLWWASLTWVDEYLWEGGIDWRIRPLDAVLPAAHAGRRSASFDRWVVAGPDAVYWVEAAFAGRGNPRERVDLPVLHAGGWWDVFQRGQLRDFHRMKRRAASQYLEMGSRDHWDQELREAGEAAPDLHDPQFLERWIPRYLAPSVRFFQRHLRGDTGVGVPAVRWHLAHVGWRESASWPPQGARESVLYLADAERAASGPEGGALATEPDAQVQSARWTHDPAHPVPYLTPDAWGCLADLPDEREVETRPDVLTFSAEPATHPLDLAGPMAAHLNVASGAGTLHVMVKLVDVAPSGRAQRIAEGAALVRDARHGARAVVSLGDTGYRLRPGHRLRLEVASSCFPRYLLHPGSDADPWHATRFTANAQSLTTGGVGASMLVLTLLPGARV